ncbi:hypothetical protein SLS62_006214 [Diatrype stigma]|uniref:Essential protein Yae1 N-terminal domain-containing protein n=1 Tax=Diatrype stigma TaxID=117547 RepID=A0AAN9V1M6_9PEZI
MTSDFFDEVLNLEEQYHQEGYEAGYRDGAEAGRIEGRSVGLKQGYEKFVEAGRLQGRALVWANRIPRLRSPPPAAQEPASRSLTLSSPPSTAPSPSPSSAAHAQQAGTSTEEQSARTGADDSSRQGGDTTGSSSSSTRSRLPDLGPSNNARLEKNVATLYGMVEPGTLSTRNDDEAVNDFDSRLKGAQGKLKVIERVVGEKIITGELENHGLSSTSTVAAGGSKNSNIEDIGRLPPPPPPPKQERPE